MPDIVALDDIELIPVVELAPYDFGAEDRVSPSGSYEEMPEQWHRHWLNSLADAGIAGLTPIRAGSWNFATGAFADPAQLRVALEVIFRKRIELGAEPDWGPLNGGLALRRRAQDVLIEPACCGDLGNAADWRDVAGYREDVWRMLWIGHPWVSVRYDAPRLIISAPHEQQAPVARWSVDPDQLRAAFAPAEAALERFARQIAEALPHGYEANARKLAGLSP